MRRYNPKEIELKWQKIWDETSLYLTDESEEKEKYYCLIMFPYPSGDLHLGHWYPYTGGDIVARFNRMLGKKVLHPFGYDSFGLPAENAAIKRNIAPAKWTNQNIESMTSQIRRMGNVYDWDRSVVSSDPAYYKWTQWIFVKLFENGLAYKKKTIVNWCPKDNTVLANEQVIGDDNVCERCDTPVIQKEMEQWFLKITEYAQELLEELDNLDWPQRVKSMQSNWIGKSTGAEVDFQIEGSKEFITVYTTRIDTLFGGTYLVLAPEHKLVKLITTDEQKEKVQDYIKETARKTELERQEGQKEKSGEFTGSYVINPANGERMPVWISDFVLANYGHGAVFADAHDERDFEFAKKFDIPLKTTIKPQDSKLHDKVKNLQAFYGGDGELYDSGEFSGMSSANARDAITEWLEKKGKARKKINYRLRDWSIGRQRYWGAPIPIINCEKCGAVAVPEDQLPVVLPEDVEFEPTGESPLLKDKDFVKTHCPKCNGSAQRETDTIDTFMDSSWYFLRYANNKYEDGPFDPEAVKNWMPVDHYIGGIEHAILHLLYARFITKALRDYAGLPISEPFKRLTSNGLILGPDGNKMSKSKGNVVNPDDQVESYGADSLRLYLMFMGPYEQGGPFDLGGIAGSRRFIERVWGLVSEYIAEKESQRAEEKIENVGIHETALISATQKTLKKVTGDLRGVGFNTAIASMMELLNTMNKTRDRMAFINSPQIWLEQIEVLLKMLAPFAPHVTEELWADLGHGESIHSQGWPTWDEKLIDDEIVKVIIQVNGKVRGSLEVQKDLEEKQISELALELPNIKKNLDKKTIVKAIYVPNKIINFVVK